MIFITKKEFVDWILAQDDARSVRMSCSTSDSTVQCAMVQFGIERFKGLYKTSLECGYSVWGFDNGEIKARFIDTTLDDVIKSGSYNKSKNFGQLKKDLI